MILETERLYLRELKQEDLDRLHAIFSDEETMRFYPAPFTREQTGQWIKKIRNDTGKTGSDCGGCV